MKEFKNILISVWFLKKPSVWVFIQRCDNQHIDSIDFEKIDVEYYEIKIKDLEIDYSILETRRKFLSDILWKNDKLFFKNNREIK